MKRIIFIEGLPGVGKTYLINEIRKLNLKDVYVVDEIINDDINDLFNDAEDKFLRNDEMKVNKYNDGTIIIDRGPISTLVYNQVMHIIDEDYDLSFVEEWFKQFLDVYNSDNTCTYYLNNPSVYNPSLDDENNPFGSEKNLMLTHDMTLLDLKKYAKNYKVFNYDKKNMKELIEELLHESIS